MHDDVDFENTVRRLMADLSTQFVGRTEIGETLKRVTAASVELIEGLDFADILIVGDNDDYQSVAPTDHRAVDMDNIQERAGQGPCLDAVASDGMVLTHDLGSDTRWPRFAREATTTIGVNSVLSFRLFTDDKRSGALNLFALERRAFGKDAEAVGAMLATHAAVALIAERKEAQFTSALASRDTIGQAKGMIMERFDVDAIRAFELLAKISQDSNTRLANVAAQLVARGSDSNQRSRAPHARDSGLEGHAGAGGASRAALDGWRPVS
jgi:transcriptional regulator with GAF, ATPase, and Fis domain